MFFTETLFWPAYTVGNLLFLIAAWSSRRYSRITRLFFLLLFGWAAWFNSTTALDSPWVYQDYADTSIPLYRWFILGPFETIIRPFILVIAIAQVLIATTMVLRGELFLLGCWNGLIFGLAIAPLGLYAAFPATVLMAIAFYRLQKYHDNTYLWAPTPNKTVETAGPKKTESTTTTIPH